MEEKWYLSIQRKEYFGPECKCWVDGRPYSFQRLLLCSSDAPVREIKMFLGGAEGIITVALSGKDNECLELVLDQNKFLIEQHQSSIPGEREWKCFLKELDDFVPSPHASAEEAGTVQP